MAQYGENGLKAQNLATLLFSHVGFHLMSITVPFFPHHNLSSLTLYGFRPSFAIFRKYPNKE